MSARTEDGSVKGMPRNQSRRRFLALAGVSLASRISWSASEVPDLLDHIILGCNDLDRGMEFVEQHLGVKAAFGGVHPGAGTRNALLSLGKRRYVEIIAPDPGQGIPKHFPALSHMASPVLVGWAAHPGNLDACADRLREAGVKTLGIQPGSRSCPDGKTLKWRSLRLADDRGGLLPFFIEWSEESVHPSVYAPAGCSLDHFSLIGPRPEEISKILKQIGIDAAIERGDKPQLRALIRGPRGLLDTHS